MDRNLIQSALRTTTATPTHPSFTKSVESFDWGFDITGTKEERAKLTEMLQAAKQFLSDIVTGAEPRWLTFCGVTGTGKTHLARKIREYLVKHGESIYRKQRELLDPKFRDASTIFSYAQEKAYFVKWSDIVESSRNGDYFPFTRACEDWIKIVDDIGAAGFSSDRSEGAVKLTSFVLEKLGTLCDRRLRKWTVLTSNYDQEQISEQFDARIASRLGRDNNVIVDCELQPYDTRK